MKKILCAAFAVLAVGCGSSTSSLTKDAAASADSARTFSRDDRPVDGYLKEIAIVKVGSEYDVTLRTAYFDRMHGHAVDNTETIGSGLTCTFAADLVSCLRDDRPVDGMLTEITLVNGADQWSASQRTAYFDLMHGKAVDETKLLASGLSEVK